MREVPRNIDSPNRAPEFAVTSMLSYYCVLYPTGNPLMAIISCVFANYLVYRITVGKPEGAAYRLLYKVGGLGKMIPSPKRVKKFEI
ncbi:MAG: hypothetical protein GY793_06865 [Proteobacteria bacterium]|nr:hypothetical protein [Pseudomonadota bacterium]